MGDEFFVQSTLNHGLVKLWSIWRMEAFEAELTKESNGATTLSFNIGAICGVDEQGTKHSIFPNLTPDFKGYDKSKIHTSCTLTTGSVLYKAILNVRPSLFWNVISRAAPVTSPSNNISLRRHSGRRYVHGWRC